MGATFMRVTPGDTIDSVSAEIQRLVGTRAGDAQLLPLADELEENRRAIARAQSRYSHLLIERYLPRSEAA